MADVATIALELDSSALQRGVRDAEESLRKLKSAGDQVGQSQQQAGRGTASAGNEMSKAAREANAYLQATARLQRAYGDYSGAVATLNTQLKGLTATSSQYVRVQAQIAQIQAQAGRVARGESFAGFAQSLKGIESQIGNLPGRFGLIAQRIQSAGSALGEFSGLSGTAIGVIGGVATGLAAVALTATAVGKSLFDAALEGGKIADSLTDLSQITGVNVASLEKLEVGYTLFGGNVEQARNAITRFSANVGQAATGEVPQLEKALKALGVDPVTASRDLDGALKQTLRTLAQSENQAAAAALATRLFGREGARLVTVYREMSDENSQLNQEVRQFGLLVGGTALTNAARIGDQFDKMEVQFRAVKLVIADQLAPSIVDLGQSFAGLLAASLPAIKTIASAFDGLIEKTSFLLNLLSRNQAAFGKLPTGQPGNVIPGVTNRFGQAIIEAPANRATSLAETTNPLSNIRQLQAGLKLPDLFQKGLTGRDPVEEALKIAAGGGDKAGRGRGAGGGGARPEKIDEATLAAIRFIEAVDKLGRQSMPQVIDTFIDAQRDIDALSAKFAVLSKAGLDTARVTDDLAKAQTTLALAEKKFLDSLSSAALTEQIRKIALIPQTGPPPGVVIGSNIPGVGGTTDLAFKRGFDGIADAIKKAFREGSGGQQQFNGPIPGQFNPGEAPAPNTIQPTESAAFKADARRVGRLITQDFLTGALLGQADAKRAGEQIAYFFADYAARKMTDALTKQLDKAFDFLAGIISKFLQRILAGASDGGGVLGNIAGTVAGAFFGGGGLPISPNSAASLLKSLPFTKFAGGGFAGAGSLSIVGENGPEMFIPRSGGWIVNQQQAAAAAGGGGMNVSMTFNISAPNGQVDRRSIDQISENALFTLSRAQRNRGA